MLVVAGWRYVAGLATYLAVRGAGGRLELARRTLRQARKRRFEGLGALAEAANRDEIDALVRQVYGAGRTLQAEIERLEGLETTAASSWATSRHELRTPIFAVTGFAETLLDGALEDARVRRRFVEKMPPTRGRLEALTRDLAEISKLETGRMQLRRAPFALRAARRRDRRGAGAPAADNGVELQVRIPDGLPLADGDRDRIRQVLANLVENALTYTNPGGHVEVAVRRLASGDVRVAVVDDGVGIPPGTVPRLTDRFFRVDRSRARAARRDGPGALHRQAHPRGARAAAGGREPPGLRLDVRVHAARARPARRAAAPRAHPVATRPVPRSTAPGRRPARRCAGRRAPGEPTA